MWIETDAQFWKSGLCDVWCNRHCAEVNKDERDTCLVPCGNHSAHWLGSTTLRVTNEQPRETARCSR